MPFTDSHGVRLHWDEQGSGGTPLLLIMGAAYSSRMWYPVIPELARHHRVIWFDNRGTGESQSTEVASIADMASDAVAVLDAAGVDQAHVYGVSLGGVVTLQLALQAPQRLLSLVLGCTGILSSEKPRSEPPSALLKLLFRLPRRVLVALGGTKGYGPAADPVKVRKDQQVLRKEKAVLQSLLAQQDALRAYCVTPEQIAALDVPALVLHGTADTTVLLAWGQELAETLPQGRLVTYEGVGHNYLVAVGDEANAEVVSFLADVDAAQVSA